MPDRERLSPLDASFLHLEGPRTHMHISGLAILEGPPVAYDRFVTDLERRLHLVPRMRQRLQTVPLGQGAPMWVDDERFDVRRHVAQVSLPPPGGEDALKDLAGRLLSRPLDRTHPLWEIWLIHGLGDGRWAMLSKVHHAVWDGVTGAGIYEVLLDPSPEPRDPDPVPWTPEPAPHPVRLLAEGIVDQAARPLRLAADLAGAALNPGQAVRSAVEALGRIGAFAKASVIPAPSSELNVAVGSGRRYEIVRGSLADLKDAKEVFGCTVNDAILSVVAGGLRRWCEHRGIDPCPHEAMVPVNVRAAADGQTGNRVAMLIAALPVDEADPVGRLARVKTAMGKAKRSQQWQGAELLLRLSDYAPPVFLPLAAKARSARRMFNLVVTNVPGPQVPLYCYGHRMLHLFPQAPLVSDTALTIGIMSYDGRLGFGLYADRDAMPDVGVVADGIESSLAELVEAVRWRRARDGAVGFPGQLTAVGASEGDGHG